MKEISKDKLIKAINKHCNNLKCNFYENIKIRDIEILINEYGDDWFISDGVYSLEKKGKEVEE